MEGESGGRPLGFERGAEVEVREKVSPDVLHEQPGG